MAQFSVQKMVEHLLHAQEGNDFNAMRVFAEQLLKRDPNNAEFLLYKLQALDGLGKVTSDIKLLHHYVNMRSTDITAFLLLYKAYMALDSVADALIALTFAMSIDSEDEECKTLLANLLAEVDPKYKTIKLNILTTSRIGHLALEIEPWARSRQGTNDDCLYLFISNGQVSANDSLFTLLKNYAHVIESPFWYQLYVSRPLLLTDEYYVELPYDLNSSLRGKSQVAINRDGYKRLISIFNSTTSMVKIPDNDIESAWDLLKKHNLHPDDKIVCLHVRDSDYLKKKFPTQNFTHHDYRDADIKTYQKAIELLLAEGYKVVRIGEGSDQSLSINNPAYIDFCINRDEQHGDFFEVFLVSVCQFFIATTSGPVGISGIFDTPTLVLNSAPYSPMYFNHSRMIPKRLTQHGKEISLLDVCRGKPLSMDNFKPIMFSALDKELTDNGFQYIDNDEQDIYDAVKEFKEQVNNRVFDNAVTSKQQSYLTLLPDSFIFKESTTLVCDSFLSKYPEIFK